MNYFCIKKELNQLWIGIVWYWLIELDTVWHNYLYRSYNVSNLLEDLKFLYRTAGQQGNGITFLFTDNEIKDEAFLEYMNNILSSGEVSGLFARDEMDEILQELIAPMKKDFPRRPPTNENLYEYYLNRCRQNLHVVLCFSPVSCSHKKYCYTNQYFRYHIVILSKTNLLIHNVHFLWCVIGWWEIP